MVTMAAALASEVHNLLRTLWMDRFNIGNFRGFGAVADRAGRQMNDAGMIKNVRHASRLPLTPPLATVDWGAAFLPEPLAPYGG